MFARVHEEPPPRNLSALLQKLKNRFKKKKPPAPLVIERAPVKKKEGAA
jgi:hypothetical protein